MFRKILEWLRGRVQVQIGGLSPERFLNLCAGNGLILRGLRKSPEGYQCWMLLPEYREARRLARKARATVRVRRKAGLPFLLFRHRKRKAFAAGILLALGLLWSFSLFLWDIRIEGNTRYTDDSIRSFLSEKGIGCGMPMDAIACEEIEAVLRNQYPQITWVSAQISGVRLTIQVKENFGLLEVPEEDGTPSDLVAEADGVITGIVTTSGIPQVSAGEQVTQGQVLISGRIPLYDDSETLIRYQEVSASGTVTAQIQVPYAWERSLFLETNRVVSRRLKGVGLRLGSRQVSAGSPVGAGAMQYRLTEYYTPRLFDSFVLPVTLELTTEYTYEVQVRRMTEAEQAQAAEQALAEQTVLWEEQGYRVARTDLQRSADAFQLTVSGTVILEGPLGVSQPLEALPEERPEAAD